MSANLELNDFHPEMNLFDALSPEAFKKLLSIARRENVESGSALLREGADGDIIHIILAGRVRVYKSGDTGEQIEIATLGTGSVFGEMSVFDGQANSASVLAIEDCILLQIPRQRLFDFLKANPEISFTVLHTLVFILSTRLRKANVNATSAASSNPALSEALSSIWGD